MNHIKHERIKKQLTKLLQKKNNLDTSIESEYSSMLDYIISKQTFNHYANIKNLLEIDSSDINIDSTIDDNLNNEYLSRLKNISQQDLDDSNLDKIKEEINRLKDAVLMNEHRKKLMNIEIKKLRTEFAERPKNIIKQVKFEKQNLFNVIERIGNLEQNNNNSMLKQYANLQEQIKQIDTEIKLIKLQSSNQFKVLQSMRTQNLEIRNKKVIQIQRFKKEQIIKNKERFELIKQRDNNDKLIKEHITSVNQLKTKISELKQNSNQSNLDSNLEQINENNETVRYLLKKIDYFVKEKNRINKRIQMFEVEKHISNDNAKVVTKLQISDEKNKYNSLLSKIESLKKNKLILINNQKELFINNMKYNDTLNQEYKRGEERILKVISRIDNSFNNDRDCLQNKIKTILNRIDEENLKKKNNLIQINKLENNINDSFKDINHLRQLLLSINNKKQQIDSINIDILSYQKLIG